MARLRSRHKADIRAPMALGVGRDAGRELEPEARDLLGRCGRAHSFAFRCNEHSKPLERAQSQQFLMSASFDAPLSKRCGF
jgi:hypothetical protein